MGRIDGLALSQQALLHHATHGDALAALSLLRRQLDQRRPPALIVWDDHGRRRWVDDEPAAPDAADLLEAAWAGTAAWRERGRWWLPLDHLDRRVGVLGLAAEDGDTLHDLEPLAQAAAALLAALPRNAAGADSELLRAALRGAGTFVWQWRPDTDELSDIGEGFAMLGYPPGHMPPTQVSWDRLIHPDDRAANHAAYLRHEQGLVDQYEHTYRALGIDGRWHWVQERGRIVERALDGSPRRVLGTQSDVTAQRELEMQALADRERLALVARHVPGVLFQLLLSADGQRGWFVYISERCEALFGLPASDLHGDAAAVMRLVHKDWRHRVRASFAASALRGTQWRCEFPMRRAGDGADRWLLGTATPQRQADGGCAWFGYLADVTDLRGLEAASRDKAAAEAASLAKTEFLSRMSHELRTPLNAVLGFAQVLELSQSPPLAEAHRRPVRLILQAGEHLLTMIGELLDLTRIESGQLALNLEAVALAPLLEESLALMQAQADTAHVTLAGDAPPEPSVRADRTRLKQVLLNLLSNAIKYNRPEGHVTLRCRADGAQVRIEVEDDGPGIAPQHLTRLFEPFERGEHRHSSIEGTGIGLAVSRSLVELMAGRIEVDSQPGRGTRFSVSLPRVP